MATSRPVWARVWTALACVALVVSACQERRCNPPRARALAEKGKFERAAEALEPCAEGDDADSVLLWNLGALFARAGAPERALAPMHRAIRAEPQRLDWQRGFGIAQLQARQFSAAAVTLAGVAAMGSGVASWREIDAPGAVPDLEHLLTAFRASGMLDKAYDLFTKLVELADRDGDADAADEALARQGVFAAGVGRLIDAVAVSAMALRRRMAASLDIDWREDDPRLLVVPRRSMLLFTSGLNSHVTGVARNVLSQTATATLSSLKEHCEMTPTLLHDGQTVPRGSLVALINACNLQQAVAESGYLSDGKSGADAVEESNAFGWTALHHAVAFGDRGMVLDLVDHDADVMARTRHGMTPLHLSVIWGTTHMFKDLVHMGANVAAFDEWGRTALRLWCERGWDTTGVSEWVDCHESGLLAESDEDTDLLTPERSTADAVAVIDGAWGVGDGGDWGGVPTEAALKGKLHCDIDVHDGSISPEEYLKEYLSTNKPVLLRGALFETREWHDVAARFTRREFARRYRHVEVSVGRIPYSATFNLPSQETTIGQAVRNMSTSGYIFQSLPTDSPLMENLYIPTALDPEVTGITTAKVQLFAGVAGTGAPAHFHRAAWNALVYGAKQWELRPPPHALYSTLLPEEAKRLYPDDGAHVLECTQLAGDLLVVPEAWGHAVTNLATSVGLASEFQWGGSEFSIQT